MEARLVGALSLASASHWKRFSPLFSRPVTTALCVGPLNIPIEGTVIVTLLLIFAYTATGGVKTLVYTDTLQTSVMLLCAGVTMYLLAREIGDFSVLQASISQTTLILRFRDNDNHFGKQFLGGACLPFA